MGFGGVGWVGGSNGGLRVGMMGGARTLRLGLGLVRGEGGIDQRPGVTDWRCVWAGSWEYFCGSFGCVCYGKSFSERTGGIMYDLNLLAVNHALVKSLRLIGACRRMVGPKAGIYHDLGDIDREVRAAAVECQRVLGLLKADENRPLISG